MILFLAEAPGQRSESDRGGRCPRAPGPTPFYMILLASPAGPTMPATPGRGGGAARPVSGPGRPEHLGYYY